MRNRILILFFLWLISSGYGWGQSKYEKYRNSPKYSEGRVEYWDGTIVKGLVKVKRASTYDFYKNVRFIDTTGQYFILGNKELKAYWIGEGKYVDDPKQKLFMRLRYENKLFKLYLRYRFNTASNMNDIDQVVVRGKSTYFKEFSSGPNAFKREAKSYFYGCPDLIVKIESGEWGKANLLQILEFYDKNCY